MHLPAWFIALAPIASFVGGYLFRYLGDYLNARHQRKREKEARAAEEQRVLRQRRESFELETLTKLSTELRALEGAAVAAAMNATTGSPDEAVSISKLSGNDLRRLASTSAQARVTVDLVLDQVLRENVLDAIKAVDVLSLMFDHPLIKDLGDAYDQGAAMLEAARRAVSQRIRGIYLAWPIPLEPSPTLNLAQPKP